jgi:hypothetical protein
VNALIVNPIPWNDYLGKPFGSGAVLVNVFGWGAPGYGDATNSDEARTSYLKFLAGDALR